MVTKQGILVERLSPLLFRSRGHTTGLSAKYLTGADPEIFQRGGCMRSKMLKEKCLLIHVSTRVHTLKLDKPATLSLFFFLFKRIYRGLLSFFCFIYYSLLFLKFERGWGCNPRNPPLDPPMFNEPFT